MNIQQQQQHPVDNFENANPLRDHYEHPGLNFFNDGVAEGMNALDLKDKCTVWLQYHSSINKNGIHNIMKNFGNVERIYVRNENDRDLSMAFVDYATFAEAARAIKALNSDSNSRLKIKAAMGNAKNKKKEQSQMAATEQQTDSDEIEEEVPLDHDRINSIDFLKVFTPNDNREKVTYFEHKHIGINQEVTQRLEKSAKDSKWKFNDNFERAEYNPEFRKNLFLEYSCCQCYGIATMRNDKTKKYYCSLSCFQKLKECDKDVDLTLKNKDKICITSIINEKYLYVRRSQDDLNHLLEQIYRCAKTGLSPLEMIPNVGDEVLAKAFDGIYRACVIEIVEEDEGMEIIVQLTDIGCTMNLTFDSLYEMVPKCQEYPKLIHKITLKDVNVSSINMDVIQYLVHLLDSKTELVVKSIDEIDNEIIVDLKDDKNNSFVSQEIIHYAKFDKVVLSTSSETLPIMQSSTGINKKLFVINKKMLEHFGAVWCVEEKFLKDFYEMQKSLNDYGVKLKTEAYGANNNEMCMAKVNDQWYRGMIQEKNNDGYPLCCLFDLSETCKVPIEDIFGLPSVFAQYPIYSSCYEVHNFMTADMRMKKIFSSYIAENNFIVADEVKDTNDGLVIHFSNLSN